MSINEIFNCSFKRRLDRQDCTRQMFFTTVILWCVWIERCDHFTNALEIRNQLFQCHSLIVFQFLSNEMSFNFYRSKHISLNEFWLHIIDLQWLTFWWHLFFQIISQSYFTCDRNDSLFCNCWSWQFRRFDDEISINQKMNATLIRKWMQLWSENECNFDQKVNAVLIRKWMQLCSKSECNFDQRMNTILIKEWMQFWSENECNFDQKVNATLIIKWMQFEWFNVMHLYINFLFSICFCFFYLHTRISRMFAKWSQRSILTH